MTVIQYPKRASFEVLIMREGEAWLVLARDHGWSHGDRTDALTDARWLAENFGVGIREVGRG
jgi:hypothetical protein